MAHGEELGTFEPHTIDEALLVVKPSKRLPKQVREK
jgi:hypothetical protein